MIRRQKKLLSPQIIQKFENDMSVGEWTDSHDMFI